MPPPQSSGLAPPSTPTSESYSVQTLSIHSISTTSARYPESPPVLASNVGSHVDVGSGAKFASLETMLARGKGADTLSSSLSGLQALKNVLEGVKTLPYLKILASIGIQLLEYVIEAQITNDTFKRLVHRVKDVILAVASACDGTTSLAARLERDLQQLTDTMESILSYATDKINRRTYKKLFTKGEDAQTVRVLEAQLSHAFHIFELQSNVSSRVMQDEMSRRLQTISPISTLALSRQNLNPHVPLRVPEGIYLIRNAANDFVLETQEDKRNDRGQRVYLVPSQEGKAQTQLWSVQRNSNQHFSYDIRNVATGLVLDILHQRDRHGEKVICHVLRGQTNQSWTFWRTRHGTSEDFCTIRSAGPSTVLDGVCPKDSSTCDDLHSTRVAPTGIITSQEWSLICLTSSPPDPVLSTPAITVPRRPLLLQNVLTGTYATRAERPEGQNVFLNPSILPARSTWAFMYTILQQNLKIDCFCITTSSASTFTLAHKGAAYINVSNLSPSVDMHQWAPSARDGTFIFRNVGSGKLLAASRTVDGLLDTIFLDERDDPACHWRLVDAVTREPVITLYDSALSVMPPELTPAPLPSAMSPDPLTLNVGIASPDMRHAMMDSFEQEHASIRSLLQEDYKALIVMPRKIIGWRNGRLKHIAITSEVAEFADRRDRSWEPCIPV